MAEVFGVITGALSVAALFNNCVECFEYIQLGRSFGRDYQTCQLRLDAARLRLSRWGEAVNVNHSDRFAAPPGDDDREAAMAIAYFEEIQHLIQGVQRSAKRYQLADPSRNTSLATPEDMTAVGNRVHNCATETARHRQKKAGILKKMSWALYDGKEFGQMITTIVALLDELEQLFPIAPAYSRLADLEIAKVDDEPSLAALQRAAEGIDPTLSDAVARKLLLLTGSNSAGAIETEDDSEVQVGNWYSDQVMAQGLSVTDSTTNSSGDITAAGRSRVQIGNRFGGSSMAL
ncbi:hypothetical protein NLU13_8604 [Sarocladium strictum]|uniref:Prion-inhibition and propagation HeLo domain-containing protein n=1 Tax=Sarocladium strictum TaxID=5046 RepID=A0AA39GBZ9_SARSR|nr:hypothetical protein NLU13_8604 [Sarocladium strictum]